MRKQSALVRKRALALTSDVTVVVEFDSGSRAAELQYQYQINARLQADDVVVTYERFGVGEQAKLPNVSRMVTLSGAWREDFEAVVSNTRLINTLHLVDGPTYKISLIPDEPPSTRSRANKSVPSTPSNLEAWAELGEALGCLVDNRESAPLRFVNVGSKRTHEVRITHDVETRSATLAYITDGRTVRELDLPLAQYKDMVAVLHRFRAAGSTFPGDPPAKGGFYIDTGAGELSAWSRDVVNPNGPRAQACVSCLREILADKRPSDFPEWLPTL